MKEIVPDERFMVVEEAIFGAFFRLTKEKELDKINVADVIKTAGIARSTFYNHYSDIPSLIDSVKEKTIRDIFEMMKPFNAKNDRELVRNYYLTICTYTMKNPFLAELLSSPHADAFFEKAIEAFHRYVTETADGTAAVNHSKEEVSYVISCLIGSTVGVLHKWSREQFAMPAEKIAEILTNVFISVLPLLS